MMATKERRLDLKRLETKPAIVLDMIFSLGTPISSFSVFKGKMKKLAFVISTHSVH